MPLFTSPKYAPKNCLHISHEKIIHVFEKDIFLFCLRTSFTDSRVIFQGCRLETRWTVYVLVPWVHLFGFRQLLGSSRPSLVVEPPISPQKKTIQGKSMLPIESMNGIFTYNWVMYVHIPVPWIVSRVVESYMFAGPHLTFHALDSSYGPNNMLLDWWFHPIPRKMNQLRSYRIK